MPWRKVTIEKTAAVSEAIPQNAPKNIRTENPNVPEKGWVVTSRTTKPSLARHKCVAMLVITFINSITSSILTSYFSFSVRSNRRWQKVGLLRRKPRGWWQLRYPTPSWRSGWSSVRPWLLPAYSGHSRVWGCQHQVLLCHVWENQGDAEAGVQNMQVSLGSICQWLLW